MSRCTAEKDGRQCSLPAGHVVHQPMEGLPWREETATAPQILQREARARREGVIEGLEKALGMDCYHYGYVSKSDIRAEIERLKKNG